MVTLNNHLSFGLQILLGLSPYNFPYSGISNPTENEGGLINNFVSPNGVHEKL